MNPQISEALAQAMDYDFYRKMIQDLVTAGKTTGANQSEMMVHFTKLNDKRMYRLDKTVKLTDDLSEAVKALEKQYTWMVISEAWCGDASQIVPVIAKAASLKPELIDLKFILRDEHPTVMDMFLTNGGKAIPKLVIIDQATGEVKGDWGARPAPAQEMVIAYKSKSDKEPYQEFNTKLQQWYNKDKSLSTQAELTQFIQQTA